MRLLGCDISPSHWAFVLIDEDGRLLALHFAHSKKIVVDAVSKVKVPFKPIGHLLPKKGKRDDLADFQTRRLLENYTTFRHIIDGLEPSHVAIEGYAFGQRTSAYTIGETTGLLKLIVYHMGIPMRIYSPNDVKIFATSKGNAEKDIVRDAVKEQFDASPYVHGSCEDVSFDLADAFVLADLVKTEALLRVGKLRLDHLNETAIRTFQRTTERNPVNLLGREWIVKRG